MQAGDRLCASTLSRHREKKRPQRRVKANGGVGYGVSSAARGLLSIADVCATEGVRVRNAVGLNATGFTCRTSFRR